MFAKMLVHSNSNVKPSVKRQIFQTVLVYFSVYLQVLVNTRKFLFEFVTYKQKFFILESICKHL